MIKMSKYVNESRKAQTRFGLDFRRLRGVMVTVLGNGHDDSSSNLDESVCFSYSANILGKGMNLIFLLPAMSK